jgi:hypothetical protein
MSRNRTTGFTFLAVGIGWLAALPAFLWFMVWMESSAQQVGSGSTAWRIWRALEVVLVEPKWLAYTLSGLSVGVVAVGTALVIAGISLLKGKSWGPKWAVAATVAGIAFCGICIVLHWTILMPAINASARPELFAATGALEQVIHGVLGIGLISIIAAGLVFVGDTAIRSGQEIGVLKRDGTR